MHQRLQIRLCNALFWSLLGVDAFGFCYWLTSRVAALLVAIHWLASAGALVFALILAAILTPGLFARLRSAFRSLNSAGTRDFSEAHVSARAGLPLSAGRS